MDSCGHNWRESLHVRSLVVHDLEWLEPLYRSLLKPYYDTLGIEWVSENFNKGVCFTRGRVIQLDGANIGYLKTEIRQDCYYIADIVLESAHHNKGIGSHLMRKELRKADAMELPTRLRVLKGNPAIQLYRRMGFVVIEELDIAFMMERSIPATDSSLNNMC